jgi:hypothetical protein
VDEIEMIPRCELGRQAASGDREPGQVCILPGLQVFLDLCGSDQLCFALGELRLGSFAIGNIADGAEDKTLGEGGPRGG